MAHVQEESIPGRGAEAITSHSHVSVSSAVDIITDLFDAFEAAFSDSNHNFDGSTISRSLSSLLSHNLENKSNELDKCNNK